MTKILDIVEKIFRWTACILMLTMISIVLLQVFARLCLPKCPSWTEEISRFLYVHIIGFAAPVALRDDLLVKVDILTNILPKKVKSALEILIRIAVLCMSGLFACSAYGFMMTGTMEVSIALVWPMIVPFSAMFICGLFMTVFSAELAVKSIVGLFRKKEG